jgi:hypothetical protein
MIVTISWKNVSTNITHYKNAGKLELNVLIEVQLKGC